MRARSSGTLAALLLRSRGVYYALRLAQRFGREFVWTVYVLRLANGKRITDTNAIAKLIQYLRVYRRLPPSTALPLTVSAYSCPPFFHQLLPFRLNRATITSR